MVENSSHHRQSLWIPAQPPVNGEAAVYSAGMTFEEECGDTGYADMFLIPESD